MTSANYVPRPDALFSKTSTATSRALSPSRTATAPRPTSPRMPSQRNQAAMRPQSPLSHRYEPTNNRFEAYHRAPSPRRGAVGNSQRRANTQSLRLPSLPRFHPANYPSHHNSTETTPDAGDLHNSPQPLLSPRSHHRVYGSDAQKHLLAYYQHDLLLSAAAAAARYSSSSNEDGLDKPDSPKLAPRGSPGPVVTPLELEAEGEDGQGGGGGYLVAGMRSAGMETSVEDLIRQEASRSGGRAAGRSPTRR